MKNAGSDGVKGVLRWNGKLFQQQLEKKKPKYILLCMYSVVCSRKYFTISLCLIYVIFLSLQLRDHPGGLPLGQVGPPPRLLPLPLHPLLPRGRPCHPGEGVHRQDEGVHHHQRDAGGEGGKCFYAIFNSSKRRIFFLKKYPKKIYKEPHCVLHENHWRQIWVREPSWVESAYDAFYCTAVSKASQCCDIFTEYSIISRHQAPRNFRTELVSPTRARLSWDRAQCSTAYTVAVRSNEVEEQREEQVNELIKEFGGLEPCVEYFYSVKTMVHTQVRTYATKKIFAGTFTYLG